MRLSCNDETINMDMLKSFVYLEPMCSLAVHSKMCIERRKEKYRIVTQYD